MPENDDFRDAIKQSFGHLRETLKEVNSELSDVRRSHERVDERLATNGREVQRNRATLEDLARRITIIEAQASGASGASNSAATWISVAVSIASAVAAIIALAQ